MAAMAKPFAPQIFDPLAWSRYEWKAKNKELFIDILVKGLGGHYEHICGAYHLMTDARGPSDYVNECTSEDTPATAIKIPRKQQ